MPYEKVFDNQEDHLQSLATMSSRTKYFQHYLTEMTHTYPRCEENHKLLVSNFYVVEVKPLVENGELDTDFRTFQDNVRNFTREAYNWAMWEAFGSSGNIVLLDKLLSNFDTLLHGIEEELPEVLTRPGNELFRKWIQQFEVEELYYPILDEYRSFQYLPKGLLMALREWRKKNPPIERE